jgi:pimeloyl-ACP methyl ester carboxylesterase
MDTINQNSLALPKTFFPNQELAQASAFYSISSNQKLHYLDSSLINPKINITEQAVVCIHGNPSWSWYFRHFFHTKQNTRILALDHLGMGLSSKVDSYFSIEDHALNLLNFLKHKKIKTVDLVVHDWGGIISLLALKNSDIKIRSIIGMNTSFFPRKNFPWRIFLTTLKPWNQFLNKNLGVFSKAASYMTTHQHLSLEVKDAYLFPYKEAESRQGIVNFLSDIPWFKHSKHYALLEGCEEMMANLKVPMMAIWGLRDFCFDEAYLNYWHSLNPNLEIHKFYDAGHWCFDDKPQEILHLSETFWSKL